MLPFNLSHLGAAEYGLWVLLGSLTVHFSTLELGYGSGLVKFVAQYRAQRDPRALNEIASTLFFVFAGWPCVAYAVVVGVAFNLDHLFNITPEQAQTGTIGAADHRHLRRAQLPVQRLRRHHQRLPALRRQQHAGGHHQRRRGARQRGRAAARATAWSRWSRRRRACGCSPTSSTGATPTGCFRRCGSGRRCSAAAGCARSPASASTRRSSTGRNKLNYQIDQIDHRRLPRQRRWSRSGRRPSGSSPASSG